VEFGKSLSTRSTALIVVFVFVYIFLDAVAIILSLKKEHRPGVPAGSLKFRSVSRFLLDITTVLMKVERPSLGIRHVNECCR
jgi:hypothetical protein